MNRRKFMFGGLFGVAAGVAATAVRASEPGDSKTMSPCRGQHEPAEGYRDVFSLYTWGEGARALMPCKHCGLMFGLKASL